MFFRSHKWAEAVTRLTAMNISWYGTEASKNGCQQKQVKHLLHFYLCTKSSVAISTGALDDAVSMIKDGSGSSLLSPIPRVDATCSLEL